MNVSDDYKSLEEEAEYLDAFRYFEQGYPTTTQWKTGKAALPLAVRKCAIGEKFLKKLPRPFFCELDAVDDEALLRDTSELSAFNARLRLFVVGMLLRLPSKDFVNVSSFCVQILPKLFFCFCSSTFFSIIC